LTSARAGIEPADVVPALAGVTSVQVLAAYLNPADQVAEVRTALVRLAEPGAPVDEPDLDADRRLG
jgi:hypothetical protein